MSNIFTFLNNKFQNVFFLFNAINCDSLSVKLIFKNKEKFSKRFKVL